VRLSSRVQRLEQNHSIHGRCAVCRERAPVVLVSVPAVAIPDNGRDPIIPTPLGGVGEASDEATPCPGCGWRPNVMEVHEVIVSNDKDEG
jgi:hypothetical protein